ncbi:60S ribosomal protein L14 [Dirofilaria immitis]|nr:60S ribosomal protein L14 [Dirofilaria immitis]
MVILKRRRKEEEEAEWGSSFFRVPVVRPLMLRSSCHFASRFAVAALMVYKRMVEIGRVIFVAKGDDDGKLAAIVDVVDGNRALIDGPSTGVKRSVRNFKDLHLTKFRIPLRHGMRTRNVKKSFDAAKINEKWVETLWAQKLAKRKL